MITRRRFLGGAAALAAGLAPIPSGQSRAGELGIPDGVEGGGGTGTDVAIQTWIDPQGQTWWECSGSIAAAGCAPATLLQPQPGDPSPPMLYVSDVVFTADALQSESGLVALRIALWWGLPDGTDGKAIHSGRVCAKPSMHDPDGKPIPPYHVDRWAGAPAPGCSIRFGFQAQTNQPNTDLKVVDGFGSVRFMFDAL